jgi:hypothetical protein|nr:MAG TPA: tail assembly protein [Caudoviricetes sp.]
MSYYFYLGLVQLPIAPAKMNLKIKGKNKTINLINEGEASIIKTPGLSEIEFEARLPNNRYPWAEYDSSLLGSVTNSLLSEATGIDNVFSYKSAEYFLNQFETLKVSKKPFQFIVCRMMGLNVLFSTNMTVTLDDYSIVEDADSDGTDVTVPLKLKEYRYFGTKTAKMEKDKDGNEKLVVQDNRPTVGKNIPSLAKISKNVTCYEAVKMLTGGKVNWRSVLASNLITNPLQSMAGKVLKL